MPSGYAYGKTLRTVKTCVGEQFCRFGTQDSMALGIALEKNSKGSIRLIRLKWPYPPARGTVRNQALRTLALSASTEAGSFMSAETAEPICALGDLLMKVKTNEEVLEYAGAYLQYYRETANYLERTSAWLERVGLSHVQSVLNDPEKRQELNDRMNETLSVHKDPWQYFLKDKKASKDLFENVVTTS